MRVTRRRCQPGGTSITGSAEASTANSAAGPKTICRRQTLACGQLSRTASIARLPLNAARARQPVDRGIRRCHPLAGPMPKNVSKHGANLVIVRIRQRAGRSTAALMGLPKRSGRARKAHPDHDSSLLRFRGTRGVPTFKFELKPRQGVGDFGASRRAS
jgi:hypothetical protein